MFNKLIKNDNKMIENIDILKDIAVEINRFQKKLALAIKEQSERDQYSFRHYASARRGALDLKNELTKLTQDSNYKYNQNKLLY